MGFAKTTRRHLKTHYHLILVEQRQVQALVKDDLLELLVLV